MINEIGLAVASTGARVGGFVCSTGDTVGVPVGAGTGASVGSCIGFRVGDTVTTGDLDGAVVTRGTWVGDCSTGASLQISLPPITSIEAISKHCLAFCEGYPELANVLPAINSNLALIPSLSTQAPQPLTSWQLAVTDSKIKRKV